MKTYIEVGAYDGIFQSRSLQFANNKEYQGILIEASPSQYLNCVKNRTNERTFIYNKCLVPFDYPDKFVKFSENTIHPAMNSVLQHKKFTYKKTVEVEASTLQSILDELNINYIDTFYLDVEGYEFEILNGIDFSRTNFREIEIELHYRMLEISELEEIERHTNFLKSYGYKLAKKIVESQPKIIFLR